MHDDLKQKAREAFDNTMIDWNNPRFLSENKTLDDVKNFIDTQIDLAVAEERERERMIEMLPSPKDTPPFTFSRSEADYNDGLYNGYNGCLEEIKDILNNKTYFKN